MSSSAGLTGVAGFAGGLAVDADLPGEDEALGFFAAFAKAACHQRLVETNHALNRKPAGFRTGCCRCKRGSALRGKLWRKKIVVGHGFFHELLEQEHFGAVDDGVDAVLEGFHRREGLERFAEQENGGVPALVHGHGLQRLQREIFVDGCSRQTVPRR